MLGISRKLLKLFSEVKSSYWFIPSCMVLVSFFLSLLSINLDNSYKEISFGPLKWIFSNEPEGARAVLSTIAASMMSVAGVTFSMTLVSISFASSQMGPRILSGFMSDRGNQLTLGTFISTFVFCLLVLRTVKGASESSQDVLFIPHISIFIAIILALLSILVLIYFINHVPQTISMTSAVNRVGNELHSNITNLYPKKIGSSSEVDKAFDESDYIAVEVLATGKGYIEHISVDLVMRTAIEEDIIIKIMKRAGDFVTNDVLIAQILSKTTVSDDQVNKVRNCFLWGVKKSYEQDIFFSGQLLVEISARALSPGVNDPYTSIDCLNQLYSGLSYFAGVEVPEPHRLDEKGDVRVIAQPVHFDEFFSVIFNSLKPYICKDFLATQKSLDVFQKLLEHDLSASTKSKIAEVSRNYLASYKLNSTDEDLVELLTQNYS